MRFFQKSADLLPKNGFLSTNYLILWHVLLIPVKMKASYHNSIPQHWLWPLGQLQAVRSAWREKVARGLGVRAVAGGGLLTTGDPFRAELPQFQAPPFASCKATPDPYAPQNMHARRTCEALLLLMLPNSLCNLRV